MPLGAFQPPKPHLADPPRSLIGAENKNCWHLAMAGGNIYILGSLTGTLYIGVTSNLYLRVMQHKEGRASVVEKARTAWAR
jgi:GIY-YIG catalytic domain